MFSQYLFLEGGTRLMSRRILGGILLGIGIVLVVAGLVLMLIIVPGMKQFPDDVNTTRTYVGTAPVIFDPAAFQFMKDLNIDLTRHFETESTDGGVALVKEEQSLSSQGQLIQEVLKRYAIDRKSMETTAHYPASWAELDGFLPRQGLVIGWPIGTEKKDYQAWNDDYRTTVPLTYSGEVQHDRAKINTYYFTASSGPLPINADYVKALGLPLEIPKEQFTALVEQTDLNALIKSFLPLVLQRLPGDNVPLAYYYEYEGEYWIEPKTGVLIDTKKHELRKVGLPDEAIAGTPLANLPEDQLASFRVPVSDFTYWGTDQSVQDAKKDAEDASSKITLYGTTLPIVAIVAGAAIGLAGIFLVLRKSPTTGA
jgi:hypothetical protein